MSGGTATDLLNLRNTSQRNCRFCPLIERLSAHPEAIILPCLPQPSPCPLPSKGEGANTEHMDENFLSKRKHRSLGNARSLRRKMTAAETLIWANLRSRRLVGWKFRRQVPIGNFVADFCCIQAKLILEIDGEAHFLKKNSDSRRQWRLEIAGYRVIRYSNAQVLHCLSWVLEDIYTHLNASVPSPSSEGEG